MNKKNLILFIVLVVLVGVAWLWQGPVKDWQASKKTTPNSMSDLNTDMITRISIENMGEVTILEKNGDRWKIAGTFDFYVNDNIMSEAIQALTDAKNANMVLVSANKDKKSSFQTDDMGGVKLILGQGETPIMNLIIGQNGSDFISTYVSHPESDKTYSVKAGLRNAFVRGDWYDRTIFSVEPDVITRVRMQYPTREFTVQKNTNEDRDEDNLWSGILPYIFSVSDEKAEKIVNIMSSLTAAKIPAQTFDGTGLENHSIIIEASGGDTAHTLMVGGPENENDENSLYYAKTDDSDNIYLITKEQKETLEKRIRDMR